MSTTKCFIKKYNYFNNNRNIIIIILLHYIIERVFIFYFNLLKWNKVILIYSNYIMVL